MRRRVLALLVALVAGFVAARSAEAHLVPVGVGTQTWIEVRPRRVTVRFNLGFSSVKGIVEMQRADVNKDGKITEEEETAYLKDLGGRVLPLVRFTLDGKPLELRLLHSEASALRGSIEAVPFDTFFDLEAELPQLQGAHELVYHEGTFENDISQQILYVVTARQEDYASFDMETKTTQVPLEVEGAYQLVGRDVTVRFEFLQKALERDQAEALIEPCMEGLQGSLDALATNVARSAEKDLGAVAGGDVRLGAQQVSTALASRTGFRVSAATATSRGSETASARKVDSEENQKLVTAYSGPFSLATLAIFMLWGALHAKGPGHGKTMVAAYLMGTKGRIWDAVRLGLIVTFTHTAAVWTLGLGLVYFVEAEKSQSVAARTGLLLTIISGAMMFLFGLGLAWRRYHAIVATDAHDHEHGHEHAPAPLPEKLEPPRSGKRLVLAVTAPAEAPVAVHDHGHDPHTHTHDDHTHSHGAMSDEEHAAHHAREAAQVNDFRDLFTLGLTGGMVPCPAAIVLILYVLGLKDHNTLKAFVYLASFSLGLGSVLIAIAVAVVLGRSRIANLLGGSKGWAIKWAPVIGAIAVSLAGLLVIYQAFDPSFSMIRDKFLASSSTTRGK
jgi:nickel/cobalt exporter